MRYIVTVVALVVVLGGLAAVKAAQIATLVANGKQAKEQGTPPEVIGTATAADEVWEETFSDVGTVSSLKGVTLSNEIPGVVTRIHFDSGQSAKAGKVLVELDTNVERAQLAAAVARKQLASTSFGRTRTLTRSGTVPPEQLDTDRSQLEAASQDSDALRAQIARKSIRAPFDGRLGIRGVNLGQYLNAGTAITVIESAKALVVDFTTPQERLRDLRIGMPVRIALTRAGAGGADTGPHDAGALTTRDGAIEAIEPTVDATTRTVKVRASVPNDDGFAKPGMFVQVTVVLPQKRPVVVVPATAIVHASFGDSVFVVEDKPPGEPGMRTTPDGAPVRVVRQQFVRTGEARGDFIAIVDGAKAGQEVVTAGAFKLRKGAPVVVRNGVQPKPELDPHPENR